MDNAEKSGWSNYLMQQQNIQQFTFHSEVMLAFTIIIAVLTGFSIVMGIVN